MLCQTLRLPRRAVTQYSVRVDMTVLSLVHTGTYSRSKQRQFVAIFVVPGNYIRRKR